MFCKTKRIISAVITAVLVCTMFVISPVTGFADDQSPIAQYKLSENLIGSSDCTTAQHTAFWDYQRNMNTADGYIKIGTMGANASKSFDKVYTEGVFVFNYSVFCGDNNFNQYYIYANPSDKKYEGTWLNEFVEVLECKFPKTTINLIGDTSQTAPKYTNGKWANCDLVINFDDKIIQLYIDNALISTVPNTLTGLGGIMLGAKNEKSDVLNFDDIALYYTAPKKFTATEMKVVKKDGTEVTLPSNIKAGDKLTLTASLHNTMGGEKPYMVSYAVYNGNMLTAVDFVEATLANNGSVTESFDYTVTNTENLKIKILVWDGIDTMTPYAGCYYAIQ